MQTVLSQLERRIKARELQHDDAQVNAAIALDELMTRIKKRSEKRRFFWQKNETLKGLYLWGGVGRGKSMLMDWFFEAAPVENKSRIHFHAFMLEVHERIGSWRKMSESEKRRADYFVRGAGDDPIPHVARFISNRSKLLCFDEFHVTDITDAMILSRLFAAMWEDGVVVVATSNREPDELYKHGLNRDLFEPFIELMPRYLKIHAFEGATDHRLRQLTSAPVYYTPLGGGTETAIEAAWNRLTGMAIARPTILKVQGRELVLENTAAGTARTTFNRLCSQPLGPADYLKLAHSFQTLILENVPRMDRDMKNEAKRFVTLIDALYETKTKLIISAEVEPKDLYNSGDGSFEFERTASRLMEMRSDEYLGSRRSFNTLN